MPGAGSALRGLIQRLIDAASEAVDVLGHGLSAAADPRGRQLRKRRWALRGGLFFGFSSVLWILLTALLATWPINPLWLLIPGLLAAGAAFPAVLCFLRYRWLRAQPLPPRRTTASHRLPPPGSAARPAMHALGASERGLVSLISVLEREEMLPPAEIVELTAAAERSASMMASTAAQVVAMERAAAATPQARAQLVPSINACAAQLSAGVRQYNEMVTAAAQLVSSANAAGATAAPIAQQRYRNELTEATDRLLGWSQAFEELGQLRHA